MQRTERTVQLLRRDAQLLRHLGGGEARNGIQHIIRIHRLWQKSVHLTLQSHHILSLDSHADHLVVHLLVEAMNLLILLADELLVKPHLHLLIMQHSLLLRQSLIQNSYPSLLPIQSGFLLFEQLLLFLQQVLLFLQGSTENLFGTANYLLLALPFIHRDITARLANLRQHHRGNPILKHHCRWQFGTQHQGIEAALVNEDHLR